MYNIFLYCDGYLRTMLREFAESCANSDETDSSESSNEDYDSTIEDIG